MTLSTRDNPPVDDDSPQPTVPREPRKPEASPGAPSPPPAVASSSEWDEILDRFDDAWQAGQSPDMDDYLLPAGHPQRLHLQKELVRIDLECRLKAGQSVRIEEYLVRHPELGQDAGLLVDLLAWECDWRRRQEPGLQTEEYVRRFPHLETELRQRLEGSVTTPTALPSTSSTAPSGYELLEVLGRGGMGVVYKARQVALNRIVALKMIRSGEHAGLEERRRFLVEAEVIAAIQHPGIVQVHEFGTNDGLPWFALEYCPGGTLAARLCGTPLQPREGAMIVEQIARAVQAAHAKGVLHRDLKPGNVLLDAAGRPCVTDFGLARRVEGGDGLTQTGAVVGTPPYMPPEQARGQKDIGPAADVYSLGAVLYECLTGRPPFKGATVPDTLIQVIVDEPAAVRRLNPKVPRDLETICLKCLQKDPRKRYASAGEMADDLGRFLGGEPIRARPVPVWERVAKWARRERAKAALVGVSLLSFLVVVGAVIAGLSVSARFYREKLNKVNASRQSISAARLSFDKGDFLEAEKDLHFAGEILDNQRDLETEDLWAEIERLRTLVGQKKLERAEHQIEADRLRTFEKPYNDALFRVTHFTGQDMVVNQARAIASARKALAIYGLDGEQDSPEDRSALLERVRLVLGSAEQARLATACYELLLIWAEAEATSPPGRAEPGEKLRSRAEKALRVLSWADLLAQANNLTTKAFHIRKARYLARSRGEPFDPARIDPQAPARPQGALDWFLEGLDRYQEGTRAEQDRRNPGGSFTLASKACLETLKQQDSHYWARYVLALCHLRGRRWVDAKMELTLCIKSRPEFTWPRLMRGFASSELGALLGNRELKEAEFDQAEIDFRSVLKEERDPLIQYVGLVNRGVLNIRRQHWQEAVKDLRQAVKVHAKGFQGHLNLAQALQGLKRWNEARAALDQAIKEVPDLPVLYENRAKLHLELKDRQSAREDFERAIAMEPPGSKSERLVKTLVELGRLQLREHQYKDARASLERALKLDPGYVLAQRFRAEALLGQHQYAEAGRALDEYMKQEKEPSAEVYKARGLIHAATGQLSRAIQCYSAALQRNPEDAETLHHRGWAYLLIDAAQLALADFEACLKKNAKDADALVGRGNAHIRLRRLEEALTDAEEARKQGPLTDRLLYSLACIYSQAAGQLLADPRTTRNPGVSRRLAMCEEKAVALLHLAVEKLPAERRESFWRTKVETHPALTPIRRLEGYLRLARLCRRPGM